MNEKKSALWAFVGTYAKPEVDGIFVFRMNAETGELTAISSAKGIQNPSYLTLHPSGRFLYAASESNQTDGQPTGSIHAYSLDPESGRLVFLNAQSSEGKGPCHVSVDAKGRFAFAANYVGGTVCVLPIQQNGHLGSATDSKDHSLVDGNSAQKKPHPHSMLMDPANTFALIPDLGLDRIMVYRMDAQGKLESATPPHAQLATGSGPRHFAFHPNGEFGYVINELNSTITAFHCDEGVLTEFQSVSTLPDGFSGNNACADIHITPNGRILYGSNRGHNSLAIFSINQNNGELGCVGFGPTQGENPRGFCLDPEGRFAIVANQGSNSVTVFRINAESGQLSPTGHTASVPSPVCVKTLQWSPDG